MSNDRPQIDYYFSFKAVWADELDIEDADTLIVLADRSGLDGAALLAAADDPELVDAERFLTREAIDRQLSPSLKWKSALAAALRQRRRRVPPLRSGSARTAL